MVRKEILVCPVVAEMVNALVIKSVRRGVGSGQVEGRVTKGRLGMLVEWRRRGVYEKVGFPDGLQKSNLKQSASSGGIMMIK